MSTMPETVTKKTAADPAIWSAAFDAVQETDAPAWLKDARAKAWHTFQDQGMPGRAQERWKFTDLRHLDRTTYQAAPPTGSDHVTEQDLMAYTFQDEAARLVFVDGHYAPRFSHTRGLPDGVRLGRTFDNLDDPRVQEHMETAAQGDHPTAALNLALAQDGAYLHVPKGTAIDRPIHFLFYSTEPDVPTMANLRNVVLVEAHAEVSLVETHVGTGRGPALTNSATWIAAGLQAHVDHVKVQREPGHATHIAHQAVQQHRDSTVRSINISLGAALCRQDIEATLQEQGAHCDLQGLFLGARDQHVDFWTRVDHPVPDCSSNERFKGILADRAHGVFTGNVMVRKDAQKTSSQQENRNLLLSDHAQVDTTPQLEIYADDVQCAHGSTIGQLDDAQVFFLRSRGIGEARARVILTEAFCKEILDEIPDGTIRKSLEGLLARWFETHAAAGATEGS